MKTYLCTEGSLFCHVIAEGFSEADRDAVKNGIRIASAFLLIILFSIPGRAIDTINKNGWRAALFSPLVHLFFTAFLLVSWPLSSSIEPIQLTAFYLVSAACTLSLFTLYSYMTTGQSEFSMWKSSHMDKSLLRLIATSLIVVAGYRLINLVPKFIDRSILSSAPEGTIASLEYSFNLISVPTSLLISVYTFAYFPQALKASNKKLFANNATAKIVIMGLIATLACAILGNTVVDLFFTTNAYPQEKTEALKTIFAQQSYSIAPVAGSAVLLSMLVLSKQFFAIYSSVAAKMALKVYLVSSHDYFTTIKGLAQTTPIVEWAFVAFLFVIVNASYLRSRAT